MITAVCISEKSQSLALDIPFVSYTEGYRRTASRDDNDIERIKYLTCRYNNAVRFALDKHPSTDHLLIIDHYYLQFPREVGMLLSDYRGLDRVILGGSIWYWARRRIRPWICYYDTLSAPEFTGKKWWRLERLPRGIMPVSGVGACWILPRRIWEKTNGFTIPSPPQAGSSRCLDTSGHRILLDCNCRLWRTHATNPNISDDPMPKRILTTTRLVREKLRRMTSHQPKAVG